ncbi:MULTISPECIES: MarR family winged helix-turn-helix transcriptional regulator [Acinetobacter]|uniref:MarR family winged helix-turn-helix transcriptional regulator n=1 Tax=Acinetobacter TaxID=469 RepID=UPI00124C18CF|nr:MULTISPECIES: MarR family transcriptional regulator [Acinetobacter]MCG2574473.1 MarR family transcriptional regulator [Acinetobacter sp. ME22]
MSDDRLLKLDNQLCFAVYSANLAFNQKYRQLLAPLGITYPQYLVMLVLWEQDRVTVSEIGKRLYLESSTLTPMLKKLEKSELITRQRSDQDERQVLIGLTKQGLALKQQAQMIPELIQQTSQCDLQTLIELKHQLEQLRATLIK